MIEEDFIAAIIESPQDRSLQTVYADWLEERNDARGELIRSEHHIWSLPSSLNWCWDRKRRRDDLFRATDSSWVKRVLGGVGSWQLNARDKSLLEAVWDHDHPIGPLDDVVIREQLEQEWLASLTTDDCLAMLDWVVVRTRPEEWNAETERWFPSLCDAIGSHIGQVGRRIQDERLLNRVIQLLSIDDCRDLALSAISGFGDPRAFGAVLFCLGDRRCEFQLSITLAEIMTPEHVEHLRKLLSAPGPDQAEEKGIREAIQEYEITRESRRD